MTEKVRMKAFERLRELCRRGQRIDPYCATAGRLNDTIGRHCEKWGFDWEDVQRAHGWLGRGKYRKRAA